MSGLRDTESGPTEPSQRQRVEGRFVYLAGLADRDLDCDVRYVSVTRHVEERFPLWQTMLHITNHTTHHRADVSTALSRLGRAPESVDLIDNLRADM